MFEETDDCSDETHRLLIELLKNKRFNHRRSKPGKGLFFGHLKSCLVLCELIVMVFPT